jgi:rSAM/selenodomain-associated transferase 1
MVDLAGAAVVAILTRAPSSGGKTRLFQALGRPPDRRLLEALLLDTFDATSAPGVVRLVAVEPADACDEMRTIFPGIDVMAQPQGDLGTRMRTVMQQLLERGARAVALVGSDLPDLQPHLLGEAFKILERDADSVVVGPAADGGYYLIAAATVPDLFADIDWGTNLVLAQTLRRASQQAVRIHLLDAVRDVDTVDDLMAVSASRTREWVSRSGL